MNKAFFSVCGLAAGAAFLLFAVRPATAQTFTVTSNNIQPGAMMSTAQVYNAHGCTGGNISPQLSWSNAPRGTRSFAVICHDPDAPREHGFYHWLIINIPADVSSVAAGGKIVGALETVTSFGKNAYGGPCPPVNHGPHRYNFTVYALDVEKLELAPQTDPLKVERLVKAHALAQTTLTGLYERR